MLYLKVCFNVEISNKIKENSKKGIIILESRSPIMHEVNIRLTLEVKDRKVVEGIFSLTDWPIICSSIKTILNDKDNSQPERLSPLQNHDFHEHSYIVRCHALEML